MSRIALYVCPLLGLAMATAQAADTLDVKKGLWETTTTVESSGTPPIPPEAMARMTPQQQAMMQERMKDAMGQNGKPRTDRRCITQKDIDQAFTDPDQTGGCKWTPVKTSSHVYDADATCQGRMAGSGKLHIEATDPEHVRGTTDMTMGTMHVKGTFLGKWLSGDCGSIHD